MSKKVCVISPSAYPLLTASNSLKGAGGAEAQLTEIGKGLSKKGYKVDYIVGEFGQNDIEKAGDFLLYKVALKYMGGSKFYIIPNWINFFITLWKINADFHIIKLPRNLFVPLGFYCKFRKRKFIFIGQIDNDVNLDYLIKQEGKLSYYLYTIGMKFVDFVIAQNELQLNGFKSTFNKQSRIIKNILTLPETSDFVKKGYVLWVGSSHQKKQPEEFINLAKQLPDIKFIMIVAPISSWPVDVLKAQADELNNLEYLGFVSFTKIAKYYQEASLFVSTSYLEGFPNTFLQSWQYETPVVSLNVDPDGIIEKNKLGKLSKTSSQLKIDVEDMMSNDNKRNTYGVNAKEYVNAFHSREAVINMYEDLLDNLS